MKFGHGGHVRNLASFAGCKAAELLDFSANINPLGPPDCLRQVIARHLSAVAHYPDPHCLDLRTAIASALSVPVEQVVCGNGSTELLFALPRALAVTRAVIPVPSYIDYTVAAVRAGLDITTIVLDTESGFSVDWSRLEPELSGGEMVIVGQPGNPSGAMFDPAVLLEVADRHLSTFFVVDEAFADFVDEYQSLASHGRPNIIVIKSMTKFYAIPGLRIGYALAPEPIIKLISGILPPWSVGSLAQAVGVAVLKDQAYAEKTREEVLRLREQLHRGLVDLGAIEVFPSAANYLLARFERTNLDAPALARKLLASRIAIRVCDNYEGLDGRYFRVAVRTAEENERLLEAMALLLDPHPRKKTWFGVKPRVPAVMFQGTSSNAGKSVLAAAFCRILIQDGYQVAPFKAQNMSLNSYVTRDGGEMGRAQVVQAQACLLEPDVRMNPVLLKPNSETGAQVIVAGKPVGNMDVNAYIHYKPQAFEAVKRAYDSLASEVDAMVIEGAGSPGEVNLKHHDIVNMTMAAHAVAPVLLVGDIDRGGVFASFVGTIEVLSEKERAMVAGFVINRFRGKRELLDDAIDYTRQHTGLPTFGVIPYIHNLDLPEEDSVSFKALKEDPARGDAGLVEIAVIDLPHISNFTDFDPLKIEPDVCLRIVRKAAQLGMPDAVILPGSKNVLGDLHYLRESGLAARIIELTKRGNTSIIGLCGGFQMLGTSIADPAGIESTDIAQPGLSLLAVETVLQEEKTLKAVAARHTSSGLALRGYEIHHGQTAGDGLRPAVIREDGETIGYASKDGRVFGTYLHGLYDNDAFRRWFINELRKRRGLAALEEIQAVFDIEPALDRLADVVRANLDVGQIYRRMLLK
jgi:cobyric acid synthase CobQ/L-threonine-O-3-phosphate decarboxylase